MPGTLGSIPDVLRSGIAGGHACEDEKPHGRALLALELVQGSPGITADRLADKLGVSERAARRYVASCARRRSRSSRSAGRTAATGSAAGCGCHR